MAPRKTENWEVVGSSNKEGEQHEGSGMKKGGERETHGCVEKNDSSSNVVTTERLVHAKHRDRAE